MDSAKPARHARPCHRPIEERSRRAPPRGKWWKTKTLRTKRTHPPCWIALAATRTSFCAERKPKRRFLSFRRGSARAPETTAGGKWRGRLQLAKAKFPTHCKRMFDPVEKLKEFIRFQSISADSKYKDGMRGAQEFAATLLSSLGFKV